MHVLVVIFKTGAEYQFFFKDRERARKFKISFMGRSEDLLHILDEHGKEGAFHIDLIAAVCIVDLEAKCDVEIATNMISNRGEVRLRNAVQTDPVLQGLSKLTVAR